VDGVAVGNWVEPLIVPLVNGIFYKGFLMVAVMIELVIAGDY
jgi:hypothetical protein